MQLRLAFAKSFCALTGRQVIAAALLLLFSWTNYAVQTHVHGAVASSTQMSVGLVHTAPAGPTDDGDRHCALCQAFVSGDSFLLPVVPVLFAAAFVGLAPQPVPRHILNRLPAHGWQGRGPPGA